MTFDNSGWINDSSLYNPPTSYIKYFPSPTEIKQQQADPASAYLLQKPCCSEKFYMGFKECEAELMRFLVENEGWDAKDQICSRLMKQLDEASKKYTGKYKLDVWMITLLHIKILEIKYQNSQVHLIPPDRFSASTSWHVFENGKPRVWHVSCL